MPTGYTAKIYEGEEVDFTDFVWICARAMGAFIMMRDDAPDAEIPKDFAPSSYHSVELEKQAQRLRFLEVTDAGFLSLEMRDRHKAEREAFEQARDKAEQLMDRYTNMLIMVKAWDPPSEEHQGLKDFMVEQLESSIAFDCSYPSPAAAPDTDVEAYRASEQAEALRRMEISARLLREDVDRTQSRNAWIKALRASVPPKK